MKKILVPLAAAFLLGGAAHAAEGGPKPFQVKRLACDRVVLTWITPGFLGGSPGNVVTVENRQGTTGLSFYVDRSRGAITSVETWESIAGNASSTSLPGAPRVDFVNCRDADTLGGIVVEYFDAKDWTP